MATPFPWCRWCCERWSGANKETPLTSAPASRSIYSRSINHIISQVAEITNPLYSPPSLLCLCIDFIYKKVIIYYFDTVYYVRFRLEREIRPMRSSLLDPDEDVNDECVPQGSHRICREVPREAASCLSPSGPSTMSSTALMNADVVLDAVYQLSNRESYLQGKDQN